MPHAGGVNQTLNPEFIGIEQHSDKRIHIINLSVGSDNGAGLLGFGSGFHHGFRFGLAGEN
jgi:hypothetical protein